MDAKPLAEGEGRALTLCRIEFSGGAAIATACKEGRSRSFILLLSQFGCFRGFLFRQHKPRQMHGWFGELWGLQEMCTVYKTV